MIIAPKNPLIEILIWIFKHLQREYQNKDIHLKKLTLKIVILMVWWQIIIVVLGAIFLLDLLRVIIGMFTGGASDFTYYISRPLFIPMKMFYGFLTYLIEIAIVVWAINIIVAVL